MATGPIIEVTFTPADLPRRMRNYPDEMDRQVTLGMKQSLIHLQGSVPPYPPPPPNSTYRRTGLLGRTLGANMGTPSIFEIKKIGEGWEGTFGTNLDYAPKVIGDDDQRPIHEGRWYTISDVAKRAEQGIINIFVKVSDRMAAFLDGG